MGKGGGMNRKNVKRSFKSKNQNKREKGEDVGVEKCGLVIL